MSVFFAIPTANPDQCGRTFAKWKAQGYMTAAMIDSGAVQSPANCDLCLQYLPGESYSYPSAVNRLCDRILADPQVQWIVTGGDDVDCDPSKRAEVIAEECAGHFHGTFGAAQPTGDRWMMDPQGQAASDRVCPSPWMGREFIERVNGGAGPFWPGYHHFYSDNELKDVAERLGVLWQRRDLTHFHDHYQRFGRPRPPYLHTAHERWQQDQRLYEGRKAAGFPGHEPLTRVPA